MTPVDLRLLPRQGLQTQIGFGLRAGSVVHHQVTKVVGATALPALAHHRVEATGAQPRVLFQGGPHEGQERIEQ